MIRTESREEKDKFYPGQESSHLSVLQPVESSMTYIDYDIPSI